MRYLLIKPILLRLILRELRNQIGYIPQDTDLLNGTVLSNIVLGNPHAEPNCYWNKVWLISGLGQILKAHEDGLSFTSG